MIKVKNSILVLNLMGMTLGFTSQYDTGFWFEKIFLKILKMYFRSGNLKMNKKAVCNKYISSFQNNSMVLISIFQ